MLLFSIFHVFFSHQHVQMITGPHEKKWCRNFFFINKISFFKNYARPKDINLEFFYLYFQLPILYARISRMVNSKLKIKSQKRPTLVNIVCNVAPDTEKVAYLGAAAYFFASAVHSRTPLIT